MTLLRNEMYEVAVVGGGPAGAVAAATLAKAGYRTVLLEASHYEEHRIGETLPPDAAALLTQWGLREDDWLPCNGNESAWGGRDLQSFPFIFNVHGAGAHVDRSLFDSRLAASAADAGVRLLCGTRVTECVGPSDGCWRLTLRGRGEITAHAVIDATGRTGRLSRSVGAHRHTCDRLVGVAAQYRGPTTSGGNTLIESTKDGWWYTAPLPPDRRIVVFMTDADLCRRLRLTHDRTWDERLARTHHIRDRVANTQRVSAPTAHTAASHHLESGTTAGRWLAVGDATMSVDPLSSSGISRALTTGALGGLAMAHWLAGQVKPVQEYQRAQADELSAYRQARLAYYGLETQWPDASFWRRRHVDA
ncbi:NAD(P)/FAD-dependent oxidoreductase [Actinocrispum wychmicini]|uniref:Flavin-dependent dehydrogenase n=1 Tax=Actinocrispum wychmicini TaxID=1213861 RepID=A0A4R2JXN2_9PSEU|nr:NAD(P)/FAD-dependent oxidoreductase [Actinocrispum wychmicini]TCO62116.1 flavin-dependent dehydrogenase [Actinocrispum wychmicini]